MDRFYSIFPCYGKLMGKPNDFPCDVEYHRLEFWWKRSTVEKVWVSKTQVSSTDGFCCILPCYGKLIEKLIHFPYDVKYHRYLMEYKKPYFGKSLGLSIFQVSPTDGFYCILPCFGKLMGKPMHLPCDGEYHKLGIWWKRSSLSSGKVRVSRSQVSHKMSFALMRFSHDMQNCWLNPCISYVMKYIIRWESGGKKPHTLGKAWVPFPKLFSLNGF